MSTHVTPDQLDRLRAGALPPEEVTAVGRHASACESCGRAVAEAFAPASRTRDLRIRIEAGDDVEHLSEDVLMTCADGRDHEHLRECESCRAEVEELRRLRRDMRPRRVWPLYAVAASVAAVAITVILREPRTVEPVPAPPTARPAVTRTPPAVEKGYDRAEWNRWVAEAKQARAFAVPAVVEEMRPRPTSFRGPADRDDLRLRPNGIVVAGTRPRLRWSKRGQATYNVILQAGDTIVESGPLTEPLWTPEDALQRGHEYAWQVETTIGGTTSMYPQTPAPPARFRVADQSAIDEIEDARKRHPDDALLHATLLARLGLRDDALDALERLERTDAALAGELRTSIDRWPWEGR